LHQHHRICQQDGPPIDFSVTLLPTSSLVCQLAGTLTVTCGNGHRHEVPISGSRTISHRSPLTYLNLAERVIHETPGAADDLAVMLIADHLETFIDPCFDGEEILPVD
jgi:hypothetical protein